MAQDDRSDDDEAEFAEEQMLDRLAAQGVDSISAPKLMVNGSSIDGKTTGAKLKTDKVTNRRS